MVSELEKLKTKTNYYFINRTGWTNDDIKCTYE